MHRILWLFAALAAIALHLLGAAWILRTPQEPPPQIAGKGGSIVIQLSEASIAVEEIAIPEPEPEPKGFQETPTTIISSPGIESGTYIPTQPGSVNQ